MLGKLKNYVIITMLVCITIPFILITDIFPFLRFGMFAESVKTEVQKEYFEVSYLDASKNEKVLDSRLIGIEPHFFFYLGRNHYYRKEGELFLKNIAQIFKNYNNDISELRLKRIIIPLDEDNKNADTTIVTRYIL
jgi:hypothetical protein